MRPSILARLEKRFGRYAVPNVTVLLIAGQVLVYVADRLFQAQGRPSVLATIRLVPAKVAEGEVWRLVTYLFDPPITNVVFAFFAWYLFYLMGNTLEATWGTFRYNVYLLIGYLASLVMAFAWWLSFGLPGASATNAFLYGSVFLAFARFYPDFVLHLFFILPVKVKWLALLAWIGYGYSFMTSPSWLDRMMIVAAVLNYLLFFGADILHDARHGHRRMQRQARTQKAPPRIVHECRVCGLTSDMAPKTQFRYCSKCEGQQAYCPDHLQNHEHVVKESA